MNLRKDVWIDGFEKCLRVCILVAGFLGMSLSNGYTQNVDSSLAPEWKMPNDPLLKGPPKFSKWVISYSYLQDRDKKLDPAQLLKLLGSKTRTLTTTKFGNVIHEELINVQGDKSERWYVGNTQFWIVSSSKNWFQNEITPTDPTTGDPNSSAFPISGFRDLNWIAKDTFSGDLNYLNTSCLVFVSGGIANLKIIDPNIWPVKIESLQYVAIINESTRLPVEIRTNGDYASYQFIDQSETRENPLPQEIIAQIKKVNTDRSRLFQQAARPY